MTYIRPILFILVGIFLSCAFKPIRLDETLRINADKKQSEISYTMVHPLHEWTGTSKNVNCIMLKNKLDDKIETVAVSLLLSSFDSKNSNRDSHALEVLDAIKYPTVKFTSNKITQIENELLISGNLTFHNIAKPLTFTATRMDNKNQTVIEGSFIINITDYQIEVPSLMGIKTKEEITMKFKIAFPN